MIMKRSRKKAPIASSNSAVSARSNVSKRVTQSTISSFHTLLKQKAIIKRQLSAKGDDDEALLQRLSVIEQRLKDLGGLEAYQAASRLGQSDDRGGDSSRVLIDWLKTGVGRNGKDRAHGERPLRMLEIGALTPNNYASCSSWIDNQPIDLHSNHPDIVQQDFFTRPLPGTFDQQFDVVSCSLVLNFVSDPKDRGRMLRLIHQHLKPQHSSLLFLVLPLPCVTNSRYLSISTLQDLMASVGFELVKERWKNGGKVGYWLWAWREPVGGPGRRGWDRKRVLQDGPKKNNFCIIL